MGDANDRPAADTMLVTLTRGELRDLLREAVLDAVAEVRAATEDSWLTLAEAAEYCHAKPSMLQTAVQSGRLQPDSRTAHGGKGKTHRFRRSTLDDFLKRRAA